MYALKIKSYLPAQIFKVSVTNEEWFRGESVFLNIDIGSGNLCSNIINSNAPIVVS